MTTLWDAYKEAENEQARAEADKWFTPVQTKKCVHTEHCCIEDGCKYDNDDCPVWLGLQAQSHPCEYCDGKIPVVLKETIGKRQAYAFG